MKPTPHGSRRRSAFLIFPFLVLPLILAVPSGATHIAQQTSPAVTQDVQDASGTLKLIVTVTDEKGRFVTGLLKESFGVFEGKSAREVTYFDDEDAPVSVGILIDVSRSIKAPNIDAARQLTAKFIRLGHPENEYFLAEFNDKWRELTPWTRDGQTIVNALRKVGMAGADAKPQTTQQKPQGRGLTALYDACFGALEQMARAAHPKRAILIVTDGGRDNASLHKAGEVRRLSATSGVLLYAVAATLPNYELIIDPEGQRNLDEMCSQTGGRAFFPNNRPEMDAVYERIAWELRHQYVVGFTPTNAAQSGKWNKVKIKVAPPSNFTRDIFVRSREGYFSPSPKPAP
ncbi:MAG TPA: VWA domain-containing protein [Pyrinomonadaceae bacterium]|nr:VWA domain-containing protein [Pyrinomonadaceae bacterium]